MFDTWAHLQQIARNLTKQYPDAVFIGGVAVANHARRLGNDFQEASHDADLYLSIQGKAEMRDRYEVRRTPHLGKDSVIIEGEDIDLYVEHQHPLGVPFAAIFAFSEDVHGIRVAALEHLLVLKIDAAKGRWGSSKGEKDVRDLARIVALIEHPREDVLAPFMGPERRSMLDRIMARNDLPAILGLNPHEGSRFRALLDANLKAIAAVCPPVPPELVDESIESSPEPPARWEAKGADKDPVPKPIGKPSIHRRRK